MAASIEQHLLIRGEADIHFLGHFRFVRGALIFLF
jgi:hypothetical protein